MQGPRLNAERDVGSITSESETLPEEKAKPLFSLSDFKSNRETTTTCLLIFDGEDGECFHKGDLAGTAGPHDRSVFLCFKNADAWLPHVEEDDPPKVVSTALKTRKDNITVKLCAKTRKKTQTMKRATNDAQPNCRIRHKRKDTLCLTKYKNTTPSRLFTSTELMKIPLETNQWN
ncbi:hypothetical protein NC652_011713 [Populus alba x Populus x berolinensis]|nr:hypothetical protein NC652_011713 [Populus alba x Populus x berolinensis]